MKPWTPSSQSELSQCVVPSWCQATEAPRPGSLIHSASLNGVKAQPFDCSGTYWFRLFARPTSAYWDTRRTADGNYRLRVRAWDAAGNSASAQARVTIRNASGG